MDQRENETKRGFEKIMHPFDHPSETTTIVGNSIADWADSINHNYLNVCRGQRVIEIASGDGRIARQILKHDPLSLVMVEPGFPTPGKRPDVPVAENIEHVSDDINFWLSVPRPARVVICFGLLYHLHNALHLIELIVNNCNPETIILDNVVAPHPLAFKHEENNIPGSRQTMSQWKYAPFNLVAPFFIINHSLDHMGYDLVKSHHVKCKEVYSKSNSWVAEWRKNGNPRQELWLTS